MGRLYQVLAYKTGGLVGRGYAIADNYNEPDVTMTNLLGNQLTSDEYDRVVVNEGSVQFVIVNRSKH